MKIRCLRPACAVFLIVSAAFAQDPVNPVLRPPAGAQVAIVMFEDLECPDCRRAAPVLEEAARTHNIPLIVHDFPLPSHAWSFAAAVMARYFASHSKTLGDQYRDYIFEHQPDITTETLRAFSERFASDHKIDLPKVVDPQGKFAQQVAADRDLAYDMRLRGTPTIYVVSKTQVKSLVEDVERSELDQLIEAMKSDEASER
jgi:protein-disulfide isomerase